ncbi:MAG: hypothetical protein CMF01_10995 [Hyphomonas sp.]|nr:hypothetical protein [Hyphomonas sp.]
MFCTQCGRKFGETDRFCAQCGAPRAGSETDTAPSSLDSVDPALDWRASMVPREIMGHPEVRARIEAVTGENPKGMSAEQFYEFARPVMLITGAGPAPPLKLIKDISLPISAKLGMKTSRDVTQGFRNTFGETLAAVLCSLASRSQPLEDITDATNGCIIRSKMLSSIWSWEGDLNITLEVREEGTLMTAAITVPGQLSDMGQSKRVLKSLVEDVMKYRDMTAGG